MMTLSELVLDTNILVHTSNESCKYCKSSRELLADVQSKETKLVVDVKFSLNESENRSIIGHEYIEHCRSGSIGYTFLLFMLSSERILKVEISDTNRLKEKLIRIIRKRPDIFYIQVAAKTKTRTLISNDYEDYQSEKRYMIKKEHGVSIFSSEEYIA